jgi:SAM-dependent methyltransferase
LTSFYEELSEAYDALFPVSADQRSFFDFLLEAAPVRSVADAGCGSGAQLLNFAAAGIPCVGFDPDPGMVELARRKLAPYPHARVEIGGFSDIARFVPSPVDLVLCLGNSLVHVPREEALRFVSNVASVLSPGGGFLLQILNYGRFRRQGEEDLPLMTAGDGTIEFRRRYLWEDDRRVVFRTSLRIAEGDGPRIVRNEILLHPLYPEEMWEALTRAGFRSIRYYGDFARSEFTEKSDALVCLARAA